MTIDWERVCEVNDYAIGLIEGVVIAHDLDEGHAVFKTDYGYSGYSQVKPLRAERDELIDKALSCFDSSRLTLSGKSLIREHAAVLIDAGWRPTREK